MEKNNPIENPLLELNQEIETIKNFLADKVSDHSGDVITINLLDSGVVFRINDDYGETFNLNLIVPSEYFDESLEKQDRPFQEINELQFTKKEDYKKFGGFGFSCDEAIYDSIEYLLKLFPERSELIKMIAKATKDKNIKVIIKGHEGTLYRENRADFTLPEGNYLGKDLRRQVVLRHTKISPIDDCSGGSIHNLHTSDKTQPEIDSVGFSFREALIQIIEQIKEKS